MTISPSTDEPPHISIVIPVFNEEALLQASVAGLREQLSHLPYSYEILLAENGSTDRTLDVLGQLAKRHQNVRYLCLPTPNYGRALRRGIEAARGSLVICEEIDLCDVSFHARAIELLHAGADFVIGSKLIRGARDERPRLRHWASLAYTASLRALLGFRGTDTHGLKAFQRAKVLPIVRQCEIERDVFASELVIRAYRAGLDVREIPVRVKELRPPSTSLHRRVPHVISNLARLTWSIRRPTSTKANG